MKFMQWNIHGNGNVADIVTHIRTINPDVISVNENRLATVRSVATTLSQQTGETWVYDWLDRGDGDGVGFLTKHRYVRLGNLRMTNNLIYTRVALAGQFTHNQTGRAFIFVSTHLVAPETVEPGSTQVRFLQANELEIWMRQFPEPRLFAGDLNEDRRYADAIDNELAPFYFDSWEEAVLLEQSSGNNVAIAEYDDGRTRPVTRLDYVFYSRTSQLVLRQVDVWPMLYSDHRAVSAIVLLP
jgi:endonuclease/exonuclease/phosphatase family metal-dependent hydrolase